MKLRVLITLLAALVLPATVFAAPQKGNAKKGHEVFEAHCQMCHGPTGKGNPAIGRMFHVKMPDLGSPAVQKYTDAQLRHIIEHGKLKMPPVQGVSSSEITNVIAFVRTLGKKK